VNFELLHLSALRRHGDLFERKLPDGKLPTRSAWLRDIFSRPLSFTHRGQRFHFAAEPGIDRRITVGRIGRLTSITENAPPEENLHEITRPRWVASVVLIDPRHHEDGQKVAMEVRGTVGKPMALFESLASQINNSDPPEPYLLGVSNIAEEETFWTFVSENEGQIVEATFELIAPNMFPDVSDFEKEMKELKAQTNTQTVTFGLESKDGLKLTTKRVQETARYAAKGGGVIKARTKSGKRFNSSTKTKKVQVATPKREAKGQPAETMIDWIKRSIGAIFR
jgi:hypothetical protein